MEISQLMVTQDGGDTSVRPHSFSILSFGTLAIIHFNPDVKRRCLCRDFSLLLREHYFFQTHRYPMELLLCVLFRHRFEVTTAYSSL